MQSAAAMLLSFDELQLSALLVPFTKLLTRVLNWCAISLLHFLFLHLHLSDLLLFCSPFKDKWVLEHDDVILGQSIGRVSSLFFFFFGLKQHNSVISSMCVCLCERADRLYSFALTQNMM